MTTATNEIIGSYEQAISLIEWAVRKLNETLPGGGVTFGYLGNCDPSGRRDDRDWYVFLPHPGRAGTYEERLGGFRTGDVQGAWRAVNEARGALRMAQLMARNTF